MTWRIGTIGFAYDDWSGNTYPPGLRVSDRLAYYATQFDAIELDTTFYATPPVERVRQWHDAVPSHFRFSLKAPQALTHSSDTGWLLTEQAESIMFEFIHAVAPFQNKLHLVFLQFPHSFMALRQPELVAFLRVWHQRLPLGVELRHDSWWRSSLATDLAELGCQWVAADHAPVGEASTPPDEIQGARGYRPFPIRLTTPHLYLRWCGRHDQYLTGSHEIHDATPRIQWWLDQLAKESNAPHSVFGVFGNSFAGHGPSSCSRLRSLLGMHEPTPMQPRLL